MGASPSALPLAWHQSSNYQTDNDSGLMLLGNRYYDSAVGRFISPDPAGDGDNWYAYCDNDPLGNVDPTGEYLVLLNGQPLSFVGVMSAGYWTNGAPTNYSLSNQPVVSTQGGEVWVATHWVPEDNGYFQLTANSGKPRDFWKELGQHIRDEMKGGAFHDPPNFKPVIGGVFGGTGKAAPNINNMDKHAINSMAKRGWTKEEINEAFHKGVQHPTPGDLTTGDPATRYVNPETGKSVVINDKTGRIVQLGGDGFKY